MEESETATPAFWKGGQSRGYIPHLKCPKGMRLLFAMTRHGTDEANAWKDKADSQLSRRERAGVRVACAKGWSGVMRGYFIAGLFRMFWIVFVVNSLPYRVRVPSVFNRLAMA